MADTITQETLLLGAVNILLETINQLPIEEEADYEFVIEARQAKSKINEVTRAVLSEGWDFNQDDDWIFPLDIAGQIPVPSNVLDITAKRSDVIMRDWMLYSKKDKSFVFEEEVPATVVWLLEFDSLTHPLRHYITIRAARIFASRTIGDEKAIKFNEIDEEDARLAARRSESRTGQFNMLSSSYGVDNAVRLS